MAIWVTWLCVFAWMSVAIVEWETVSWTEGPHFSLNKTLSCSPLLLIHTGVIFKIYSDSHSSETTLFKKSKKELTWTIHGRNDGEACFFWNGFNNLAVKPGKKDKVGELGRGKQWLWLWQIELSKWRKSWSNLGHTDGGVQLLTRPCTHTHTPALPRDFWRANNEGMKGEEAENWL